MVQSIQKIIKIGSSFGVTIPAKELKRQNINLGNEVEVTIRPLRNVNSEDQEVINIAKNILKDYKSDFADLARR